jgi:hypothetical protein
MKIELVKEVELNGETYYSTEIDGKYVENSISKNYEIALKNYKNIKDGERKIKEVIKSEEI